MASVFGKPRAGGGPQSAPLEVNLAILGRRGAGKSALTVKFLTRRFISEYDPNLEDTYSSEETVDHQPVHLRVMDTADLDTPRNCERYLNWAHAFLVVYSVDSRQSFEGSSSYLELLALHAKETQRSFPALLLGNKLDMAQYRGHRLVFAPELPAELSLGGQCARACGSRAHLGALHLAHAQAWSLLRRFGVTDLLNEWPLMANRLHLTFTVSKNQEPNTFLLICWPQLTRKHPNPPASPEEQAGQDPLSGAPSLQGDVWYAHSGPLFPGLSIFNHRAGSQGWPFTASAFSQRGSWPHVICSQEAIK
ncbi:ras-like protein family member 12 isoform X2 [Cervus canadensis]|uniref:ras-like protein family member 12 isoform X2 n=1 Tax=Cervus canadensis TaxID=1574408 RepID=UPI001C9E4CEF|nr:ras-like protein family member 12 isoform X2 [Cervus canadensis]